MKAKSIALLSIMAAAMAPPDITRRAGKEEPTKKPKPITLKVYKGHQMFYFDQEGNFETGNKPHAFFGTCIFKCLALNEKNAIKKFKAWRFNELNK